MRKKILINFCLLVFLSQSYSMVVFAKEKPPTQYYAYDGMDIGARPIALGGAFVAVSDTADAPFWNPAGLYNLKSNSLSFMLNFSYQSSLLWEEVIANEPLRGKRFSHLVFASPQGAISWRELSNYTEYNYFQEVIDGDRHETWKDIEVKINQYMFSVCKSYSSSLIGGINMSYLSGRMAVSEKNKVNDLWGEAEQNISDGSGLSFDWGFIYVIRKFFHGGIMFQNFPGYMFWDDYKTEQLPLVVRMGFAMKMTDLLTFSWDYEDRMYEKTSDKKIYHVGLEQIIMDTVFLRGGMNGENLNQARQITYTAGIGFKKEEYVVDLAMKRYHLSVTSDEVINNFLCSLSVPF